ncbi:hypothetical protein J6590_107891, partial [Homalodisca vitripennis]
QSTELNVQAVTTSLPSTQRYCTDGCRHYQRCRHRGPLTGFRHSSTVYRYGRDIATPSTIEHNSCSSMQYLWPAC